ncbi:MAG: hypothetical protein ACXWEN_12585, partial [Actinomycetota bacterium]
QGRVGERSAAAAAKAALLPLAGWHHYMYPPEDGIEGPDHPHVGPGGGGAPSVNVDDLSEVRLSTDDLSEELQDVSALIDGGFGVERSADERPRIPDPPRGRVASQI